VAKALLAIARVIVDSLRERAFATSFIVSGVGAEAIPSK